MKNKSLIKGFLGLSFIYDCLTNTKQNPELAVEIYKHMEKLSYMFSEKSCKKLDISNIQQKSIWNENRVSKLNENEFKYLLSDIAAFTQVQLEQITLFSKFTLLDDLIIDGYESISDEEKVRVQQIMDDYIKNIEKYL